tara:strand:- start:1290 stop:1481 length:192 start_codon:yes stop_codon:yes gene_type:complete
MNIMDVEKLIKSFNEGNVLSFQDHFWLVEYHSAQGNLDPYEDPIVPDSVVRSFRTRMAELSVL